MCHTLEMSRLISEMEQPDLQQDLNTPIDSTPMLATPRMSPGEIHLLHQQQHNPTPLAGVANTPASRASRSGRPSARPSPRSAGDGKLTTGLGLGLGMASPHLRRALEDKASLSLTLSLTLTLSPNLTLNLNPNLNLTLTLHLHFEAALSTMALVASNISVVGDGLQHDILEA